MKTQSASIGSDGHDPSGDAAAAIVAASHNALSGVSREFHSFLTDIEDLIETTTSMTSEDLTRIRGEINTRVKAARESIKEAGGEVTDRARDAAKEANKYVHEQPWQAIGAGALIGLFLGLLARRG